MGLILNIARLVASVIWLVAAGFLATTTPQEYPSLRVIAAVFVGLPGAMTLAGSIRFLSKPGRKTQLQVKRSLQSGLINMYRTHAYSHDIMKVSFHVWVVPMWYRILAPYVLRRYLKPDTSKWPKRLRPRLTCLVMFRFEHKAPSGIKFRKGVGLVGRCIEHNQDGHIFVLRLNSAKFRKALTGGDEAWRDTDIKFNQNLTHQEALRLSESYGQVAAMVIRETSGEAIGCVTLDLPKDSKAGFIRTEDADPLQVQLRATASAVQNHLQRRPLPF